MDSPVGYQALCEIYNLSVVPHYRKSYISDSGRGYMYDDGMTEINVYPNTYAPKNLADSFFHLEFALKYDGVNLAILAAVFSKIPAHEIEVYVRKQPTGKYSRIIWFLYEFLLGKELDFSLTSNVSYTNVLDPDQYFVINGTKSKRHKVNNNLLGTREFCPIIRKTKIICKHIDQQYDLQAKRLLGKYDGQIIERACYYLYTKETVSSYKIEREVPNENRLSKFVSILENLSSIECISKEKLLELQNLIVDPRFKDTNYRITQNYVGETINYQQRIHYISPRPGDVECLMNGLLETLAKCMNTDLHSVVLAAVISFGFVFIHPFEDGNGRLHRFLIHYILAKLEFTVEGIIFPVSAVMLQKIREYDQILETFSKPLLQLIKNFDLSQDGFMVVNQDTAIYYKYIDFTKFVEYLFACIAETLQEHFATELKFLLKYDEAKKQIQSIVDMPDRLIDLFIKLVCQNHGTLSKQKRQEYFSLLTDAEISDMQAAIDKTVLNHAERT